MNTKRSCRHLEVPAAGKKQSIFKAILPQYKRGGMVESFTPPLVDIMIAAERQLERRLALCLALHPHEVFKQAGPYFPEIDPFVIKYWSSILKQKSELQNLSNIQAVEITFRILVKIENTAYWRWFDALADENSFTTIQKTLADIRGLRIDRKAAIYIEKNRLIESELLGVQNGQ